MAEEKKKPLDTVWPIAALFTIILVVGISYFTSPKFDHKYSEKEKAEAEYSKKRKEHIKQRKAEEKIANQPCKGAGDRSCITEVRKRFRSIGQEIASESYEGNGAFRITAFQLGSSIITESIVYYNCDCEIIGVPTIRVVH